MRLFRIAGAVVLAACVSGAASAAEVKVEMLNRDKEANLSNVYKPALVKVNKGDTVKWVATSPGHNVAFIQNGVPAGVALFVSRFQKEVTYKFEKPGIYLYKCTPHVGLGMVGLVVVGGDKSNLAAVKAVYVPPLAKKRLEPLFAQIAAGG
jgi:pseudoazurin